MKPMSTDVSELEKGENTHLLSEALVKPIPEENKKNGHGTGFAKKIFGIKKPCKWIRCLCWTMAILTVVLIATMITCALVSYIWTRHQVRRFTIVGREKHLPNPPLPIAPVPEAQVEIVKDEAKLFWDQLRAGVEPKQDLVISEENINGLIAESDFLRGHALVTVEDGKWTADLALPAHKLPGGKGRFFVGKGTFELSTKEKEEDSSSTNNKAAVVNIVTQLTSKYPVRSLNYPNLVDGKFEAYSGADGKPVMEMDYGQFLNWVAPDDFIAKRENLLDCDFDEHCHDHHHHHHHHHHHREDDDDDDDDDHHHHHFHHHDHDHHHHHQDDKEECLEAMAALARLESVTIQDKKIIFKPVRGALTETPVGNSAEGTNEDKDEEDDMDTVGVMGDVKKLMESPAAENGEGGLRGRRFLTDESFSIMSKASIARRILRKVVF